MSGVESGAGSLVTGFQDFLQLAEVLGHGRLDPWRRQPGSQPEDARRRIKGHLVREPRSARRRLKQVADPGAEGTDLSPHRQALARFEGGNFEAFLAPAGMAYRRLGIPALDALTGAGVFYGAAALSTTTCAATDAAPIRRRGTADRRANLAASSGGAGRLIPGIHAGVPSTPGPEKSTQWITLPSQHT